MHIIVRLLKHGLEPSMSHAAINMHECWHKKTTSMYEFVYKSTINMFEIVSCVFCGCLCVMYDHDGTVLVRACGLVKCTCVYACVLNSKSKLPTRAEFTSLHAISRAYVQLPSRASFAGLH